MQSPIKDQGQRGTCVAFAATAGHEYLRKDNIDLSEEFLYWGCKQIDGIVDDNGTTLSSAIISLKKDGQAYETDWPYNSQRLITAQTYNPPRAALQNALNNKITYGVQTPINVESVKERLKENYAVIVGVILFEEFFNPIKGFISLPQNESNNYGGHAILIAGWEDSFCNGVFIIRNSWGLSWGLNGYAYLPYDYFLKFTLDVRSFKHQ